MPQAALIAEFLLLFVGLPVAYRFSPWPIPALPALWVVALYCWWQLHRDATFAASHLWNTEPLAGSFGRLCCASR